VNFYPFHIGDYLAHTSHLNDKEDLAYRRMMDWYYLNEKPFPPDIETIARLARTTPETIILILADFFYQDDNGYYHSKRADEELAKYKAMQDGGRKGAEKRWAKGGDSPPKHPPMQTKNQEPLTNNHSIEVAKAPKAQRLKIEELPDEWQVFCKTERPDLKPEQIWNQFRDYWIAQGGQKGAKLDWFATWRNWVRNQKSVVNYTTDKPMQKWDATLAGVLAKGKELGIEPKRGETEGQYRERLRAGVKT